MYQIVEEVGNATPELVSSDNVSMVAGGVNDIAV